MVSMRGHKWGFRVSHFTENNIVNEEQRRDHIDSLERPPIIVLNVSSGRYSSMS